jgi:hypothetical protein
MTPAAPSYHNCAPVVCHICPPPPGHHHSPPAARGPVQRATRPRRRRARRGVPPPLHARWPRGRAACHAAAPAPPRDAPPCLQQGQYTPEEVSRGLRTTKRVSRGQYTTQQGSRAACASRPGRGQRAVRMSVVKSGPRAVCVSLRCVRRSRGHAGRCRVPTHSVPTATLGYLMWQQGVAAAAGSQPQSLFAAIASTNTCCYWNMYAATESHPRPGPAPLPGHARSPMLPHPVRAAQLCKWQRWALPHWPAVQRAALAPAGYHPCGRRHAAAPPAGLRRGRGLIRRKVGGKRWKGRWGC